MHSKFKFKYQLASGVVATIMALGLGACTSRDDANKEMSERAGQNVQEQQSSGPMGPISTGRIPSSDDQKKDEDMTKSSEKTETTEKTTSTTRKSKSSAKKVLTDEERKEREGKKAKKSMESDEHSSTMGHGEDEYSQNQDELEYESDSDSASAEEDSVGLQMSAVDKSEIVCAKGKSKTPMGLRQDLEYSFTEVDCHGDLPVDGFVYNVGLPREAVGENNEEGERGIASETGSSSDVEEISRECTEDRRITPSGLRSDLAYSLTGLDCVGDLP